MYKDKSLILSVLLKQINGYVDYLDNRLSDDEVEKLDNTKKGYVSVTLDELMNNTGKVSFLSPNVINDIKRQIGKNKDLLLYMLNLNGLNLQYGSEELRNNEDVVKFAIFKNPEAMQYASDRLKQSKSLAIFLAKSYREKAIDFMSPWLKNDSKLALKLVSLNGNVLLHLSERLQNTRNIVLQAVETNPVVFFDLQAKYRGDLEVAQTACERDFHCYKATTKRVKDDKPLALKMIHHCYKLYPYLSKTMKEDSDVIKTYKQEIKMMEDDEVYRDLKTDVDAFLCANLFNTKIMYMRDEKEIEDLIKRYSIDKDQEQTFYRLAYEFLPETNA